MKKLICLLLISCLTGCLYFYRPGVDKYVMEAYMDNLASQLMSSNSKLWEQGKSDLMTASIHQAQGDFINHPVTQGVITGISFLLSGVQIAATLSSGIGKSVAQGTYSVYQGTTLGSNTVRYVGITGRSVSVRAAEHAASGTARAALEYSAIKTGLTQTGARVVEQNLINQYGLMKNGGQLLNRINSVARKNWVELGIKP